MSTYQVRREELSSTDVSTDVTNLIAIFKKYTHYGAKSPLLYDYLFNIHNEITVYLHTVYIAYCLITNRAIWGSVSKYTQDIVVYDPAIFPPVLKQCENAKYRCVALLLHNISLNILHTGIAVLMLMHDLWFYDSFYKFTLVTMHVLFLLFLLLCSGWLYRLVSGLSEVPGPSGWAGTDKMCTVLWLHPSQLQPGTECGP